MKRPYILGIIPARGGSKGIPNKNIINVLGKPLIAYSIEAAKHSASLTNFIVSTDSPDIAKCSEKYGAKVHKLRPVELSTDDTKSVDVAVYEIQQYEMNHDISIDIIVLLQPTAPMRLSKDIDSAIDLFLKNKNDSLISVCDVGAHHPNVMYTVKEGILTPLISEGRTIKRRQNFSPVFLRNGALYIATKRLIVDRKSFIGNNPLSYIMPKDRSVNIDEPFDIELAEMMIKKFIYNQSEKSY